MTIETTRIGDAGGLHVGEAKQVVIEASDPTPELVTTPAANGDGVLVALAEGYSIERFENRHEGTRNHVFDDVLTFAQWLNRHALADANEVEILLSHDRVKAVLKPRDQVPELISCMLEHDPTFKAWCEAFAEPIAQKAFHALARGFRASLVDSDKILAALRVINVARTGELKSEIDETGFTRLQVVGGGAEMTAKLPPEIRVDCPVYQGVLTAGGVEDTHQLEILVSIDVDGTVPIFELSCPGLELVRHAARRGVAAMLKRELDDGFLVGLGELDCRQRSVLNAPADAPPRVVSTGTG